VVPSNGRPATFADDGLDLQELSDAGKKPHEIISPQVVAGLWQAA